MTNDVAARIFFESGNSNRSRRIDCMTEDEALSLVRAGDVRGWQMGVGLFNRAYPGKAATERQIATASLPGNGAYRDAVRSMWQRIADEHFGS